VETELLLPYQAHLLLTQVVVAVVNIQKTEQLAVLAGQVVAVRGEHLVALLQLAVLPILVVAAVVVVGNQGLPIMLAAQAVQVSSSLNTSPNLITKSSNHQAHGLHLVALLRSST
jgi:hypothetical protein